MPRRFIAGAVCPGCGAQDTTVLIDTAPQLVRECVRCKHHERLDRLGAVEELPTRVSVGSDSEQVQTITLLDPNDSPSS